jgi:hypothetical protein
MSNKSLRIEKVFAGKCDVDRTKAGWEIMGGYATVFVPDEVGV